MKFILFATTIATKASTYRFYKQNKFMFVITSKLKTPKCSFQIYKTKKLTKEEDCLNIINNKQQFLPLYIFCF